jgi:hypothetical protein
MIITAEMDKTSHIRHRWSVQLFAVGDQESTRAHYGARIGSGQTQRILAAAVDADCVCRVTSAHEVGPTWESDFEEVVVNRPRDLAIRFHTADINKAADDFEGCVLSFEFSQDRSDAETRK